MVPAFHKQYYESMAGMFARCTQRTVDKLEGLIRASGAKVCIRAQLM